MAPTSIPTRATLDDAGVTFRPIDKALEQASRVTAEAIKASTGVRSAEDEVRRAQDHDSRAQVAAVRAGEGPPEATEPAAKTALEEALKRRQATEQAVNLEQRELEAEVVDARAALETELEAAVAKARDRAGKALDELVAATEIIGRCAALERWVESAGSRHWVLPAPAPLQAVYSGEQERHARGTALRAIAADLRRYVDGELVVSRIGTPLEADKAEADHALASGAFASRSGA